MPYTPYLDVLHDHVDVGRRLYDLVQADDVRVHEQAQDLDLAPHCGGGAGQRKGHGQGGGPRARVVVREGLGATLPRGLHPPTCCSVLPDHMRVWCHLAWCTNNAVCADVSLHTRLPRRGRSGSNPLV